MKYEFLIQPLTPGVAHTPETVEKLLDDKGATARPDGVRVLRLKHGDIELGRYREGAVVVGTEVKVQMNDTPDLVCEAFLAVLDLAQAAQMRVVDPQLSRTLSLNDESAVIGAYQRGAEYAGRYAGVSSAVTAAQFGRPESPVSPGTRLALILVAIGVVLYLIFTY